MSYEELWATAYAIGFHLGRNPESEIADRDALQGLVRRQPEWSGMIQKRFRSGRAEGNAT